jgi:hypothetical protein
VIAAVTRELGVGDCAALQVDDDKDGPLRTQPSSAAPP